MDTNQMKYTGHIAIIVLVFALWGGDHSQGAQIDWPDSPCSYISKGEPLREMLLDFSVQNKLNPVISDKVTGEVNGQFLDYHPRELFEFITTAYGLVWYFDGNILYISTAGEMDSRIIRLNHISPSELVSVLEELDISDSRYPAKSISEGKMMYVSGPSRYVDLVAETARLLDVETGFRKSREIMQVFVLKHAWADDRTFYFMDREIRVPGVASILCNILAGGGASGTLTGTKEILLPNTVPKLKGKGLAAAGAARDGQGNVEDSLQENSPGSAVGGSTVIQADTRLNAVIIRDSADKMDTYRQLIEMLDIPTSLVEIKAAIIDVSTESLEELGVSWRFNTGNGSGGFRADSNHTPGNQTLTLGDGLNVIANIGNLNKYFLSRVEALQKDGKAEILARPSVLTLDNQEARLEHSQTFYVKVAGDQNVDLFKVSAGIVLKVTPHVIMNDDETKDWKIRLTVKIEDGDITENSVDNLPVIQNSTINTQAVVRKDESLLIGGYSRKSTTSEQQKVPVLGDIPLLGLMFRHKEEKIVQTERFFVISPRLVMPHGDPKEFPAEKRELIDKLLKENKTASPGTPVYGKDDDPGWK